MKDKKAKTAVHGFIEILINVNVSQIKYGLIKEKNFIVMYAKNGSHTWPQEKWESYMRVIYEPPPPKKKVGHIWN